MSNSVITLQMRIHRPQHLGAGHTAGATEWHDGCEWMHNSFHAFLLSPTELTGLKGVARPSSLLREVRIAWAAPMAAVIRTQAQAWVVTSQASSAMAEVQVEQQRVNMRGGGGRLCGIQRPAIFFSPVSMSEGARGSGVTGCAGGKANLPCTMSRTDKPRRDTHDQRPGRKGRHQRRRREGHINVCSSQRHVCTAHRGELRIGMRRV